MIETEKYFNLDFSNGLDSLIAMEKCAKVLNENLSNFFQDKFTEKSQK